MRYISTVMVDMVVDKLATLRTEKKSSNFKPLTCRRGTVLLEQNIITSLKKVIFYDLGTLLTKKRECDTEDTLRRQIDGQS